MMEIPTIISQSYLMVIIFFIKLNVALINFIKTMMEVAHDIHSVMIRAKQVLHILICRILSSSLVAISRWQYGHFCVSMYRGEGLSI
mgnify:FL=1